MEAANHFPQFSISKPRAVMEDMAQYWVWVMLSKTDLGLIHEVMEAILPAITPLSTQSPLAYQLRIVSLWQEILFNTEDANDTDSDFALLQDKFLLLSKHFHKTEESEACMTLLKVHEIIQNIRKAAEDGQDAHAALKSLRVIYKGELPTALRDHIHKIYNNKEKVDSPPLDQYFSDGSCQFEPLFLRKKLQYVLQHWLKVGFDEPTLVQFRYLQERSSTVNTSATLATKTQKTLKMHFRLPSPSPPTTVTPFGIPEELSKNNSIDSFGTPSPIRKTASSDKNAASTSDSEDTVERTPLEKGTINQKRRGSEVVTENIEAKRLKNSKNTSEGRNGRSSGVFSFDEERNDLGMITKKRRSSQSADAFAIISNQKGRRKSTGGIVPRVRSAFIRKSPYSQRAPFLANFGNHSRKRLPFSRKEVRAIQAGVERFGWDVARIKAHYPQLLLNRPKLHIEDQMRHLLLKGKIPDGSMRDATAIPSVSGDES